MSTMVRSRGGLGIGCDRNVRFAASYNWADTSSLRNITTPQSIYCRTDVWSPGVVSHHLLTDGLPFED